MEIIIKEPLQDRIKSGLDVIDSLTTKKLEPILIGKSTTRSIRFPVIMFSTTQLLVQTNSNSASQVIQTRYGINDIVYKVALKESKLMVENEIYFPGRQADLIFHNK